MLPEEAPQPTKFKIQSIQELAYSPEGSARIPTRKKFKIIPNIQELVYTPKGDNLYPNPKKIKIQNIQELAHTIVYHSVFYS
jgi:hypothetical protein